MHPDLKRLKRLAAPETRLPVSERLRLAHDFILPPLKHWNDSPCDKHRTWTDPYGEVQQDIPNPLCRKCGIRPRRQQRVGAAWLYVRHHGLLADAPGSGKTAQAALVMAMMKETKELHVARRALVVVRSPAVLQWTDELNRMLKDIRVVSAHGMAKERAAVYRTRWEVLVIGQHSFLRDHQEFSGFNLGLLVVDDVDAIRNRETKTAEAVGRIAALSHRLVVMTGTPLQKRLPELYNVLEPLGGRQILGTRKAFTERYVKTEVVTHYLPGGRRRQSYREIGYQNLGELKQRIAPLVLRRTAADLEDTAIPGITANNVWLDLYPVQRRLYKELQDGVLQMRKTPGQPVSHLKAMAKIHMGARICAGLASMGEEDGPKTSVKLDWLMHKLTEGGLEREKVVVFAGYIDTVKAVQNRLQGAGIGFETIWGPEADKMVRKERLDRFWEDDTCRVLIGTQAIEQSLNLQCSRHLVNIDLIMNPARMEQLAGRIRRDGSAYKNVYVHNLLTVDTQEARYLATLEREQALIDFVWDENSELFEKLPPERLLALISG